MFKKATKEKKNKPEELFRALVSTRKIVDFLSLYPHLTISHMFACIYIYTRTLYIDVCIHMIRLHM